MNLNPMPYIKSFFVPMSFTTALEAKRKELLEQKKYFQDMTIKAALEVTVLDAQITALSKWLKNNSTLNERTLNDNS